MKKLFIEKRNEKEFYLILEDDIQNSKEEEKFIFYNEDEYSKRELNRIKDNNIFFKFYENSILFNFSNSLLNSSNRISISSKKEYFERNIILYIDNKNEDKIEKFKIEDYLNNYDKKSYLELIEKRKNLREELKEIEEDIKFYYEKSFNKREEIKKDEKEINSYIDEFKNLSKEDMIKIIQSLKK